MSVSLGLLLPAAAAVIIVLARQAPEFYTTSNEGVAKGADALAAEAVRQRASGRFLSKVAALAQDMDRPGKWSTVIDEAELNAWFAVELPENHPAMLPAGVEDLRVQFASGRVLVGCRIGGPLAALAWAEVRLRLLEANRLALAVERCRLGLLPLPAGIALSGLDARLEEAGLQCEMLHVGGRAELVAQLPATEFRGDGEAAVSCRVDGLRIDEGEVFITGSSRRVESRRGTQP